MGGEDEYFATSPDNGATWVTSTIPLVLTEGVTKVYDIAPLGRYLALPDDMCNSPNSTCQLNGACAAAKYWRNGPIDTGSGNHTYQVEDLSVPVAGGALSFERTYASQNVSAAGTLGYGWTHNYAMRLVFADDPGGEEGYTIVTAPDGSRLRYFEHGDGTYTPYPGVQGTLVRTTQAYVLTGSAQTVYTFDDAGQLTSIRDPQGRATTLTYDTTGRLSRVSRPDEQRYIEFAYDGNPARLVEVRDHTGRGVSFGYNQAAAADLAWVVDTRGYTWTYSYTRTHLLDEVIDPNGHLVERTRYDGQGRAMRQWSGDPLAPTLDLEIEFSGATRIVTDALGATETVSYDARNTWTGLTDAANGTIARRYDGRFNLNYVEDANGNPTEIAWSDCGCRPESITDALENETGMLYDAHNNLVSTIDALGHTTLYDYDLETNLLLSTTDALDQVTYYAYSDGSGSIPAGLLTWTKDPLEHETRYQYDGYGQLLSTAALSGGVWITTTRYVYDELGRVVQTMDALDRTQATFYDGGGHVTRTVENCTTGSYEACRTVQYATNFPDRNVVTGYTYDGVGNRTRVTNTLDVVTLYEYDVANRLIRTVENYQYQGNGQYNPAYPDRNVTTRYGYDAAGNQVAVTDTLDMVARTFYDELNRPERVVDNYQGNGQYDPAYPDRNVTTRYGYDAAGNQVTVTNPLEIVTVTRYDGLNRLVRVTQNYTTTTPNPDPNTYSLTTRYGYDRVGNQDRVTDTRGVVTRYEYDALDRPVLISENHVAVPGLPGPLGVTTRYGYDAGGKRAAVTNSLGIVTRYEYNDLNRLVRVVENYTIQPQGTGGENVTTQYRYDLVGNRLRVIDPLGTVTRYDYDQLDRLVKTWENYIEEPAVQGSDVNVTTRYQYDGLGNCTRVINAYGTVTRYDYDQLGRLVKTWENYYEPAVQGGDVNVVTSFAYDGRGNRIAVTDPAGKTTRYGYDALSRLIALTDPLTHTTAYAYDAAGNQVTVTDPNDNATHYSFDGLGRVVQIVDPLENSTRYAYDAAGNRTAVTDAEGVVTRYGYDALSRLIAVTENYSPTGPIDEQTNVRTAYGYDLLGNLQTITNARGYTTTYAYDDLSRLTTEADPLGHTWRYGYDALGRRTVVTDASGIRTAYSYDRLGRLLAVVYGNEEVTATYAYDALGERVAMTDTTGVTRYRYDDLGQVRSITHTTDTGVDYTIGYAYDARGLRTALSYPDGTVISYTYDAAARLTGVLQEETPYATYQYDNGSRLTSASLGNGVSTSYSYDHANRLLGVAHRHGGDLLARFTYGYDRVGNRTQAAETVLATANGGQAALPGYEALSSGPRPAGLAAPPVPPQHPPIARLRATYRASFDADGLRFSPRHALFGEEHTVAYQLTVVRQGHQVLFHPDSPREFPMPAGEDGIAFSRGESFREEYALTAAGVEQRFVFSQTLAGEGDLVIEGNLTGDLRPVLDGDTGEISFYLPGTDDVVASYGRAIVADATGERIAARLELDGAHLRIVVPGEWLAQATYPVVVDPLIGINFAVSTQAVGDDQNQAAAAYGGGAATLVVWADHRSQSNWDIYGQLVSAEGELLSPTMAVCTVSGNQQYPDVAADVGQREYLVVWQGWGIADWDIYGQRVSEGQGLVGGLITFSTAGGHQQYPAVAHDEVNGRYLVVWQDGNSIYGRLLLVDGSLSPIFTIASGGPFHAYPDVAYDAATQEYLVVWQQYNPWSGWDVVGQIVSAGGNLGPAVNVAVAAYSQVAPAVTYGVSETQYLVVYQGANAQGINSILGRLVNPDGTPDGPAFTINGNSAAQQSNPAVVYGEALQEYLVTWEEVPVAGGAYDVRGARVSAQGQPAGGTILVDTRAGDQRYPAVAYDGAAAAYVAVWQDKWSTSYWDVYGREVEADGSLPGAEFLVSSALLAQAQQEAAVAYGSAQGLYLVVYRDEGSGHGDIHGRLVSGGGALVGTELVIAGETAYIEGTPAVAYDEEQDEFLVVWARKEYSGGIDWHVYGRRVEGDGNGMGTVLEISTTGGNQTAPAVAYNGAAKEFLVVWEADLNAGHDLYGRRVDESGPVGEEIWITKGEGEEHHPDLAAGPEGYLVVWEEMVEGNKRDVYGLFLGTDGTPGWEVLEIAVGAADQAAPAVAGSAGEERYLVVWQEAVVSYDVWGRFVERPGPTSVVFAVAATGATEVAPDVAHGERVGEWAVAWQESAAVEQQEEEGSGWDVRWSALGGEGQGMWSGGEALSVATGAQEEVALAWDGRRGRYLAVWQDGRNTSTGLDIYAQLARGYTVVIDYEYDPLYRLVGASASDGAEYGFQYDAVGNRLVYTDTAGVVGRTTYSYDAADRLAQVVRAGVQTAYSWSDRGELLDDGVQEYEWDAAGRLTGVSGPEGLEVGYTYDGANNRTQMVVNGAATSYVVDPFGLVDAVPQVLLETTGGQSTRDLYGLDLLAQQQGGATNYLGYDALSVRLHLDDAGAIAASYRYAPFGEVVGEGPSGYGFTGERWDEPVGLLYLRARYYAPGVGRFVSFDPWPGEVDRPSTQDRYVYAVNQPTALVDRAGFFATSIGCYSEDNQRNLTDWLVREMNANANSREALTIGALNKLGATPLPTRFVYKANAFSQWYNLVADGHRWDFKNRIYDELGPSIMLCDGQECGWFTYQVPGNIHYGYVGRAAGLTGTELHMGAGWAEMTDHSHGQRPRIIFPPGINPRALCPDLDKPICRSLQDHFGPRVLSLPWRGSLYINLNYPLLDEPNDYAAIELGIKLYGECNRNVTKEAFGKWLRIYKNQLQTAVPRTEDYYNSAYPYPLRFFNGGK